MFGSLAVVHGWVVGPVFGSWVTAWVSSGCGFWRGCGLWVVRCGSAWLGRGYGSVSWDEAGRWSWIGG